MLKKAFEMREERRRNMKWGRLKGSRSENKKALRRERGLGEWKWVALRASGLIFVIVVWIRIGC